MLSVLILTLNEAHDLPACLESVAWSDDLHVLDSFSSDATVGLARTARARVTQRGFDNWANHQNWAVTNLPFKHPWVLYLDADERVSPTLRDAALACAVPDAPEAAFRIRRRDFYADGTWLKHAQISPFYIRLFRPERIRYERLVNPVAIVDGPVGELDGFLDHHPFSKGTGFWIQRHLKYADFEAQMILQDEAARASLRRALFATDFHERRRHQKALFYRLPLRPLLKFAYLMIVRRAFLDGQAGLTYACLQSIYEYFIVLKTRELCRALPHAVPEGCPGPVPQPASAAPAHAPEP
jgi:glycosyltransferase involved in cell wall biosynthesis